MALWEAVKGRSNQDPALNKRAGLAFRLAARECETHWGQAAGCSGICAHC